MAHYDGVVIYKEECLAPHVSKRLKRVQNIEEHQISNLRSTQTNIT